MKQTLYRYRKEKNNKLLRTYGITLEDYEYLKSANDGICTICGTLPNVIDNRTGKPRALCVDHDHLNGIVRGLLCINCNKGLGVFKDSIENLQSAIKYLTLYKEELEIQGAPNQIKK